jgi:hypothetical protein
VKARILRVAAAWALALVLSACQVASYPYYLRSSLNKDTSLVIYIDDTGSMDIVHQALSDMIAVGGPLYEGLHKIYGSDYGEKVKIIGNQSENTLSMLAVDDLASRPNKCIVFVFQDENDFSEDVDPDSLVFQADMKRLKDRIDGEFSFYRGVLIQIVHPDIPDTLFEVLLRRWEEGSPPYDSENQNFSRFTKAIPPKIRMLYRVPFASADYYGDLVLKTLEDMGIEIPD